MICWNFSGLIIKKHISGKINEKFILSNNCSGYWLSVEERRKFFYFKSNHLQIIFMIKYHLEAIKKIGLNCQIYFSHSFFTKVPNKANETKKEGPRKFFKLKPAQQQKKEGTKSDQSKQNVGKYLENLVNRINEANKYFKGIKLNTNYLKVFKSMKYEEALRLKSQKVTPSDLPIQFSKKKDENSFALFDSFNESEVVKSRAAQITFSRANVELTIDEMKLIIKNYMVSLAQRKKFHSVEPNFELHSIKILNSLKQNLVLQIKNEEELPQIKIKSITLFKGVSVCRNANYSTDSYSKQQQELNDGIITFKLFKQVNENYPQPEWLSTQLINARFQLLVKGGPSIEVLSSGNSLGSTQSTVHNVVIETDLTPPPPLAIKELTPQDYIRNYRLNRKKLWVTNFDRKNEFFNLTYSQTQKKNVLINELIQ